jgi:hypothetical protein
VGGNILPDGSLDITGNRPLACEIRMVTLADYVSFCEACNTGFSAVGRVSAA